MAHGWTLARKATQRAAIYRWRPWDQGQRPAKRPCLAMPRSTEPAARSSAANSRHFVG
jgi:hypothetical protein